VGLLIVNIQNDLIPVIYLLTIGKKLYPPINAKSKLINMQLPAMRDGLSTDGAKPPYKGF